MAMAKARSLLGRGRVEFNVYGVVKILTDPLCRATTCHGDDVKSASRAYLRSHALLECSEK
eukprot:3942233-Pleurochrysis_carterae.AAC.1